MKKSTKGWLVAAVSLVLVGAALFVGVMIALDWDFNRLSTRQYETATHTITEDFTHISVTANTADVTFAPSEDDSVSVVCYEDVHFKHTVAVEDNTLVIRPTQPQKWYHYIGIGFEAPTITVYLPAGTYGDLIVRADTGDVYFPIYYTFESMDVAVSTGDVSSFASVMGALKIRTTTGDTNLKAVTAKSMSLSSSTGDIFVKNSSADDLRLSVTTGKTTASGVRCRAFTSTGSTGDLFMRDVLVTEGVAIIRSTGGVTFDACDAAELTVTTDTGDIMGTLRTMKTFVTHTDTGNVQLPHRAPDGGECKLTTNTGNIHISLVATE